MAVETELRLFQALLHHAFSDGSHPDGAELPRDSLWYYRNAPQAVLWFYTVFPWERERVNRLANALACYRLDQLARWRASGHRR